MNAKFFYAKIELIIKDVDCDGITYNGAKVTYTDDLAQPFKFKRFPNSHAAAQFARSLGNVFIIHANGNTERIGDK